VGKADIGVSRKDLRQQRLGACLILLDGLTQSIRDVADQHRGDAKL
jgi:hypothetical protein